MNAVIGSMATSRTSPKSFTSDLELVEVLRRAGTARRARCGGRTDRHGRSRQIGIGGGEPADVVARRGPLR